MIKILNIIRKIIKAFNGNKTAIGAICLFIIAIPHIEKYLPLDLIDILSFIGMSFSGVGVSHKIKKFLKKKKDKK